MCFLERLCLSRPVNDEIHVLTILIVNSYYVMCSKDFEFELLFSQAQKVLISSRPPRSFVRHFNMFLHYFPNHQKGNFYIMRLLFSYSAFKQCKLVQQSIFSLRQNVRYFVSISALGKNDGMHWDLFGRHPKQQSSSRMSYLMPATGF